MMRCHEPLLAMRRRGLRPDLVLLTDVQELPGWRWWEVAETQHKPEVYIEPADVPELLDLRFVVGMAVLIDLMANPDPLRLKRLVLACEAAGSSKVLGYAHGPRNPHTERCPCIAEMLTVGEDQTWRI